jgi:hypothetical protein
MMWSLGHRFFQFARCACYLALVLVVLGAVAALTASPAQATTVKGTFHYKDTNPATGAQTDRPIVDAKVEIWRFRPRGVFWSWGKDAETTTDASGNISVNMPFAENGVIYQLRVFATNDAAIVWPNDFLHTMPFHREPGDDDNARIHRIERSASDVLDFSYTFHGWSSQHFNIAEVARHAKAYADARRDPSETDPIPPAAFQPTSVTGTYYNPVNDTVVINSDDVYNDFDILHEYAHYLEEMISTFAPIPTNHDGCTANLGGLPVTWPQHAWMEGFADYFAQAVGRSVPPGTLTGLRGTPGMGTLESPSCAGLPSATIPGDFVENLVAGTLWDLYDQPSDPSSLNEAQDTLARMDREIFQIFDRELDQVGSLSGRFPTITDFRDAWMARGLPGVGLSRIMVNLGLPLRSNYGPTADAGPDQSVNAGTVVTLDGRASSDPDLNPLNFTWTQLSGPAVTLANPSSATPSFTAPHPGSGSATLIFRLVVNDGSAPPSAPDEVAVHVLPPPPPNDNFANAQLVDGSNASVSGTTRAATRELGEPDHLTSGIDNFWIGDHSVWYRWKAPASGTSTMDTCAANIDSILAVYTGSALNSLSRVADNNNDFCGGGWGSKVTFNATAGTTYQIAVGDAGGLRESTFTLKVSGPTDTTPPRVTTTVPAATSTGVAPGANITATFSEAMDASTINGTTFKLFKAGTTTVIGAEVSYDPATKKAILNPNANLKLGTKYKAAVTTGAKDLAGNQLDQDSSLSGLQQKGWSFTIRN